MKSSTIGATGTVVVVVSLAIAAFAYAAGKGDDAGSRTDVTVRSERSEKASEAEAAVARTSFVGRLEAALGDNFGGVWFEPSTAQVYVGVISPGSRWAAHALAVQTGLEETVTETPVRSTWAELEAAQDRWDRQLADLLQSGAAATSLMPDRNALSIELLTTLPSAMRTSLERQAASESVNVLVEIAPKQRFGLERDARCKKFKYKEVYCDKPIVAGVTITAQGSCTAGPAAVLKDRSKKENATKTYLLTAGHCLDLGGGLGKAWHSYDKEGKVKETIGPAHKFINAETDVGVIEITSSYWANPKDPVPVDPTVARWSKTEETDPFPVIQQEAPMVNAKVCISGQSSGLDCGGQIKAISVTNAGTKNLVEVVGLFTEGGDSGAPWFTEANYMENPRKGHVLGTHVGSISAEFRSFFQPLEVSFTKLKEEKGIDLELLTQSNKIRHPVFIGAKYPVTVAGKDALSEDQFTAFGATVTCKEREFTGAFAEPKTEEVANTIEVTPAYKNCADNKGLPVNVAVNGCKYKIALSEKVAAGHYKALVSLVCPQGAAGIQFKTYMSHSEFTTGTNPCEFTVPPQEGLKSLTLTNSNGKIVIDKGTVEGVKVKIVRKDCFCPGGEETMSGVYHVDEPWTVAGSSGEEVKIEMAGG